MPRQVSSGSSDSRDAMPTPNARAIAPPTNGSIDRRSKASPFRGCARVSHSQVRMPPATRIARSARVRVVRTKSGMTAGHACELGFAIVTPTSAHSGRDNNHITAGAMTATAAAMRTHVQVRRDGPCHSSAAR